LKDEKAAKKGKKKGKKGKDEDDKMSVVDLEYSVLYSASSNINT
jgi:hypothetical protein